MSLMVFDGEQPNRRPDEADQPPTNPIRNRVIAGIYSGRPQPGSVQLDSQG